MKKTAEAPTPGQLLKIDEAAKFLRVRRSFLYEETRKGQKSRVPHVRVGRYIRFRPADLESFLQSNAVGGTRRG
jgi:excisionase family DNA binding protein